MASVNSAVVQGADVVEVDIRTTVDGVWVLMHDGTVTRTVVADSNKTGKAEVDEMTYAELQTLALDDHLGRCVDPAAEGFAARCRVPALADVLDVARGRILVMLDWKGGAATSLGQLLAAKDATSFAFAFDSDIDELEIAEAEAPGLSIMPRAKSVAEVEALLARRPFDMIHVDTGYLASLPREFGGRPVKYFVDVFIEVDLYAASHELSGNREELEQARVNYLGVLDAGAFMTQADHAYLMREWIDEWRSASPHRSQGRVAR